MEDKHFIQDALENLEKNTGIIGIMRDHPKEVDGAVELVFRNKTHLFLVEVKKEVRQHQIPKFIYLQKKFKRKVLLIAENILPGVKEELRELKIPYIETNGNIYAELGGNLIWVELKKANKVKFKKSKAFTPAGIQVVFELLVNPGLIELTQREIAERTQVALGLVNNVFKGLQTSGFIIPKTKDRLILTRKEELLNEWLTAYHQRLMPKLRVGTFRFANKDDFQNWNTLTLNPEKTKWGGEPAGNLLTGYLYPQELTIYTTETQKELIQKYKMVPDQHGNIEVLKMFWNNDDKSGIIVPPLLTYADLINKPDKRCRETAQLIYDKQIKNRLI